jgi:hypothetical protein
MFKDDPTKAELIEKAVTFFSDYDMHRTHSRPLTFNKVKHLGLKISLAEKELRNLFREAHILLDGFFNATPFVKIYENSQGLSFGKQFQTIIQQSPPPASSPK